ncbi:MAG: sulfatase [Planctomycetaceae bacterium]|nr:sulfatase [Planctomycetaceae bacterium]
MPRRFLTVLCGLAVIQCLLPGLYAQPTRPNVVFILADDLGWSDTTLFGTTRFYRTPNVERLAARGMTFTRAYSASPLCSPTRAAILTGLSPARVGITTPSCHLPQVVLEASAGKKAPSSQKAIAPATATRLKTEYRTLSKSLREAGYVTGHFGKWHLGHEPYSPLEHGFEQDVPHWPGPGPAGSYVAPWKFPDFDPDTPDQHLEDRMADEAVAFIEQHRDQPFFLNYWMFSVHAPFDAKKSLIEDYRSRVDPADPQRSPTYAAMVHSMDDAIGTLLDTLDRLHLTDNTIIVMTSDNGGNMYNEVDGTSASSNAPLRGGKATMFEGGVRVPAIVVWPQQTEPGSRCDQIIFSCDYYPTLLEMLGLVPHETQRFDGISIVPALRKQPLQRDGIFVYFPHNPSVPDWIPPAVSMISERWKLIRIFHGGENGMHRWKLFDLQKDAGEHNDVAALHPDIVSRLDQRIEQFLEETHAVRPIPNPDFDPAAGDSLAEGKAALRGSTTVPRSSAAKPQTGRRVLRPSVAGWQPSPDCRAGSVDGQLIITSEGNDPSISYRLEKKIPAGDYVVALSLSSTARGRGQFFWQEEGVLPAFFRDRSVTFDLNHDGAFHSYDIAFRSAHDFLAVRLDPGQAAGTVRIRSLHLKSADGTVIRTWDLTDQRSDGTDAP